MPTNEATLLGQIVQAYGVPALSIVCGVLGWFARELYQAVNQLRKDMAALELRMGTDYVRYDRMHDAMQPVLEHLQRIEERLNRKEGHA